MIEIFDDSRRKVLVVGYPADRTEPRGSPVRVTVGETAARIRASDFAPGNDGNDADNR